MESIASPAGAVAGQTSHAASSRRLALGLLLAAYTLNFIDRTIIATIGQAIKTDLRITDTQLGLLGGLYFALLYTLLGVPIARLAERMSRVNIVALAILVWSGFTALCGAAQNFATLALYRFGVGVGEAGCSPPAHSLIADIFEPRQRASALSIYAFGIPLGTMIGAVAGGWLAQNFSWRIAFLLVGAPGLLLAVVMKLAIKEPPRPPAPAVSWRREFAEIGAVIRTLFASWPVCNLVLGVTLASFAGYGVGQFAPPYFIRTYGLGLAQVGLVTGLVGGFSAGVGTLIGGFLSDRLARRSPAWYALTPGLGLAAATPLYLAAYGQARWQAAALILLIPGIFHYTYLGPTFGVVQNMVPAHRRATATAVLFLFLNLIALGGGPPFTGWLIDRFAGFAFHSGAASTLDALANLFAPADGGFQQACPGGAASAGAPAALAERCHASLALATRQGIRVTIFFYAWAAAHYLAGSVGLANALARARSAQQTPAI